MIIEILVCRADGTQELVQKEVPEDYFGIQEQTGQESEAEGGEKTEKTTE